MEQPHKDDTLHTGLLTLDRKHLISPNHQWPELFTDAFDRDAVSSVESQARWALGTRGIMASTDRILLPPTNQPHRGYLLREASRINIDQFGFAIYSHEEVEDFTHLYDESNVAVHFLSQIVKHMRPLK